MILLGASNLTLGLAPILEVARQRSADRSLEVLMAGGHGRCYGIGSRFLARGLPPILDCGLWRAATPPRAALALVTDVGNDLMQGVSARRIADWIAVCVERLRALGAETVLTLAPEESLERLDGVRYLFFRTLLYPGRRLALDTVRNRAAELNRRLAKLASRPELTVSRSAPEWYGRDGIHIRWRQRRFFWEQLLSSWPEVGGGRPDRRPLALAWRSRPTPERCTLFGFDRERRQPSAELSDGSTLSVF